MVFNISIYISNFLSKSISYHVSNSLFQYNCQENIIIDQSITLEMGEKKFPGIQYL